QHRGPGTAAPSAPPARGRPAPRTPEPAALRRPPGRGTGRGPRNGHRGPKLPPHCPARPRRPPETTPAGRRGTGRPVSAIESASRIT
ncbi:DUF3955 domain-containing protein, partial [Dysosmobacter welbionis]